MLLAVEHHGISGCAIDLSSARRGWAVGVSAFQLGLVHSQLSSLVESFLGVKSQLLCAESEDWGSEKPAL